MRGIGSRRATVAVSLAVSIFTASCAGDGGSIAAPSSTSTTMQGAGAATLAEIQTTIFTPSCGFGGCHDSFTAAGGLDLSTVDDSFNELVGIESQCGTAVRVVPGDANASYLLDKLGDGATPCGFVMPIGSPQLSTAELRLIRSWIDGGAAPPSYAAAAVSTTSTTLLQDSAAYPTARGAARRE